MITLALIICISGLAIYLLADPALRGGRVGRVVRVGEIAFFVGLFGVVWFAGGKVLL